MPKSKKAGVLKIAKVFICLFLLTAYHLPLTTVFAAVSVNVPIHNWAYGALETLNMAGLVDAMGLSTKPMTRMEAARLTRGAISCIQKNKLQFSIFDEGKAERAEDALDRLVEEFRTELIGLGVTEVAIDEQPVRGFRFRLADPISTQTIYADLGDAEDLQYENQRGFMLKDGFNSRSRFASWIEFKDFFALEIEPVARFSKDTQDFDIETGYIKLGLWNVEIEAGRDTLWWGPGFHGSMLVSDNAYPLNLVKIGSAHPFTLPWEYEALGKWNIDLFIARLEDERDRPRARLGGLRLECAPCDYFNFGISRTAIFGGKGRPHLDASDYWDMFTAFGKIELSQDPKTNLSDQKASVDFRLNIPWYLEPLALCSNLQLYGEWAGEDKFAPWENEAPGYLAGLLISDMFKVQNLDLRMEYARTNSAWYTHGIYSTGYRYKGNVLGHHMGGDAEDLFVRLSRDFSGEFGTFERVGLGGQFDYETHSRSATSPERKYEFAIDGTFHLSDTKSVKLLYEYEGYRNFGNVSGEKSRNTIFEVGGNIKF